MTIEISNNGASYTTNSRALQVAVAHRDCAARLLPSYGSMAGGTLVTMKGCFQVGSQVNVAFGAVVVACSVENEHWVNIRSPPANFAIPQSKGQAELVSVRIQGTVDGTLMSFEYYVAPVVEQVIPSLLSAGASAPVKVVGKGFLDTVQLTCVWLDSRSEDGIPETRSDTIWKSSSVVQCAVPPQMAQDGSIGLEVSNNGVDFTTSGIGVIYHPSPTIYEISSSSVDRGNLAGVILRGEHFRAESHEFTVLIGSSRCPVDFLRSSRKIVYCYFAGKGPANATVQISNNGVDFSTAESLVIDGSMETCTAEPSAGPQTGGTGVVLQHSAVDVAVQLTCRFGDVIVPGRRLGAKRLLCTSPYSFGGISSTTHWVDVSISRTHLFPLYRCGQYGFVPHYGIAAVTPSLGSLLGGNTVIIHLAAEMTVSTFAGTWACRFGSEIVVGFPSPYYWTIHCQAPGSTHSHLTLLEVLLDSTVVGRAETAYFYHDAIGTKAIAPSQGTVQGGTLLSLTGTNFDIDRLNME
eukprot:2171329-Rhodomonas_salina.1